MNLQSMRVADLGRVVTGRTPPSARGELFGDTYPFLTPTDIDGIGRYIQSARFLSEEGASHFRRIALPKRAICVVCIGATIGKVCLTNQPSFCNQQINAIVVDEDQHDALFVYYLMTSLQGLLRAEAGGTATPILNKSAFSELRIQVPPRANQARIARFLGAFDDLLENNVRRIQILEEMARSIYREWFVDRRFPGRAALQSGASGNAGLIPPGWRMMKVSSLLQRCPARNVYREGDLNERGGVAVFDQSTNEVAGFHDHEPDYLATPLDPVAFFGDHTCRMRLLMEPFSIGPNVVPFRSSSGWPLSYVFFLLNGLVRTQEYKRHWSVLTAKEVLVADQPLTELFAENVRPFVEMVETLRRSVRTLYRARDLLLPRLLSGGLRLID